MAIAALLGGSFIGTFGGLFGWLLFGMSAGQVVLLYLALGLLFPVVFLLLACCLPRNKAKPEAHLTETQPFTA